MVPECLNGARLAATLQILPEASANRTGDSEKIRIDGRQLRVMGVNSAGGERASA
ncbi:hypothetical protein MES5069_250189 [Mesorhizobium escarrei]|uniref:Uncharacterized protein n=1 Tax=Mesorhizobium escarrei TaxID=666018 RepID=A0ABN8JU04_9HYPH|nr:hypothetical protein MES5069_250189 [Mesorhizobium escarrei]